MKSKTFVVVVNKNKKVVSRKLIEKFLINFLVNFNQTLLWKGHVLNLWESREMSNWSVCFVVSRANEFDKKASEWFCTGISKTMKLVATIILFLSFSIIYAKVYMKCELAKLLKVHGVDIKFIPQCKKFISKHQQNFKYF